MNELKTIFSAVQTEGDAGSLAELRYDDVIRVRADSAPGGVPLPGALRLSVQGGPVGMTCTDPKCVAGVPPMQAGTTCSIEIQMPQVVTQDNGRQFLLAGPNGAKIGMPILDASVNGDALCEELSNHRVLTKMKGCVAFHFYDVVDVLGASDLEELKGKRIAVPVPMCPNAIGPL